MHGKPLRHVCHAAVTVLSLLLCSAAVAEAEDDPLLTEQRRAFQSARQTLKQGDIDGFQRLEPYLVSYPLYPYLRYDYLRSRIGDAKPEEIRTFLIQYPDTPVATQLRYAWLQQQARHGRWKQYLEDYGDMQDSSLRCHYATALFRTGRKAEASR